MQKSIFTLVMAAVLCFGAVVAQAADPEMNFNLLNFVVNYDKGAEQIKINKIDQSSLEVSSGAGDSYHYQLTPFSRVTLYTNSGRKKITSVTVNGAGNGTKESGALILASALNSIKAILPDLQAEQLKEIMQKLGFFGDLPQGKKHATTVKGVTFSSKTDKVMGFYLTAEPAAKQ